MSATAGGNPDFRGIPYEKASVGTDIDALNMDAKQDCVRKFMYFVDTDLFRHVAFATRPGTDGRGKPAFFQEMALLKPSRIGRKRP